MLGRLHQAPVACTDTSRSSLAMSTRPSYSIPTSLSPPHPVLSYKQQWQEQRHTISEKSSCRRQIVNGAAWNNEYLVACTSLGWVHVYKIPFMQNEHTVSNIENQGMVKSFETFGKVKVSKQEAPLLCIQFSNIKDRALLSVGGEEGVLVYEWKDWLEKDELENVTPIFQSRANHRDAAAVHDFCVDEQTGILYAASGNFCVLFNLGTQQVLKRLDATARVNTVKFYKSNAGGGNSTVLTGQVDGTLRFWDGQQGTLVDTLDICKLVNNSPSLMSHAGDKNNSSSWTPWPTKVKLCIAAVDAQSCDSDWWVVAGAAESSTALRKQMYKQQAARGGFLATIHAPTRSLVAFATTRETIQNVSVSSNNHTTTTVANEGVVSQWSLLTAKRRQRAWCSPPSVHAIAIRSNDGCMVVGGVADQLDLFDEKMTKVHSLPIDE